MHWFLWFAVKLKGKLLSGYYMQAARLTVLRWIRNSCLVAWSLKESLVYKYCIPLTAVDVISNGMPLGIWK